jgi:hypothetical protein
MIKTQAQQISGHHSRQCQLATRVACRRGAWCPPGHTRFLPLPAVLAIPITSVKLPGLISLHGYYSTVRGLAVPVEVPLIAHHNEQGTASGEKEAHISHT